ncbi:MAG: pyruvate dehydrogenase (acetyl-transferring) component, alpha subunit [Pseudomonadota bacterium]
MQGDTTNIPTQVVKQFEITYTQCLQADGTALALPHFANPDHLKRLYSALTHTRLFDAKAIALQRTGKMGTYPSVLGQEAIGVGIGAAMSPADVLCPYYRELGAQLWRGVKMAEILAYWGGDERGNDFSATRQDFPICVPIASQTLHAVGVATALQYRKIPQAVVTVIGDGGTSRGDFYEAMNLAGVWQLPVVFVINNNGWAISVPSAEQTHAETFAQKSIAAGIMGEQVDGNDVIAVQYAVERALNKAKMGGGPSVIEAITHRMGDHTTADDARRYRDESVWKAYQALDPILRLKTYLVGQQLWDEVQEQSCKDKCTAEIALAVAEYESMQPMPVSSIFTHLYANLPSDCQKQIDDAVKWYG